MKKARELAKIFRDVADLYEELADIEENEELDPQQKEESQEQILAKVIILMLKYEKFK